MNGGQSGMGMDEAMLDYMLEMGALTPEQEQLARQRQMVDQLRATPQPGMRQAGRMVVAANPLEHLAGVAGQGLASYKERGADAAAKGLQDKKLAGIKGIRDRWGMGKKPTSVLQAYDPLDPQDGPGIY